jgi:hypothetical protein
LHQARPMRLQGGAVPADPRRHDIHTAVQRRPEPCARVQLRALRGPPPQDDGLWH